MSSVYVERLRKVSREYDAARQAIDYVIINYQAQSIYNVIPVLTPRDFEHTSALLEHTYFIRLFAEFEGILKDHLDTNHPTARWRGKSRAEVRDKLDINDTISLVVRENAVALAEGERQRLLDIRDYRNSIAHLNRRVPLVIHFRNALSRLNTFLAKLPDPLR